MQSPTSRVVMIGDSSVGKTSIVHRMCRGQWTGDTRPTVSTAFYTLKGDESQYQQDLQIWDTAGAERYRALNSVYYHNATGGILVFDLTNRTSFDSLSSWVDEFMSLAQPGALLIVIGNKCDLVKEFQVKPEEGEKWAKTHSFKFFTTSAQDGTNINELANYLLQTIPGRSLSFLPASVNVNQTKKVEDKKGCCH